MLIAREDLDNVIKGTIAADILVHFWPLKISVGLSESLYWFLNFPAAASFLDNSNNFGAVKGRIWVYKIKSLLSGPLKTVEVFDFVISRYLSRYFKVISMKPYTNLYILVETRFRELRELKQAGYEI
jgi:hypothetical protein